MVTSHQKAIAITSPSSGSPTFTGWVGRHGPPTFAADSAAPAGGPADRVRVSVTASSILPTDGRHAAGARPGQFSGPCPRTVVIRPSA